jgi:hypothetical protein
VQQISQKCCIEALLECNIVRLLAVSTSTLLLRSMGLFLALVLPLLLV